MDGLGARTSRELARIKPHHRLDAPHRRAIVTIDVRFLSWRLDVLIAQGQPHRGVMLACPVLPRNWAPHYPDNLAEAQIDEESSIGAS